MSIRTILAIVAALTCGGAVAIGVTWMNRSAPAAEGGVPTEAVVVVVTDVPRGRLLGSEDVAIRQWPQGMLPKNAITALDDAQERVTLMPLAAEEPLLQSKLASKSAGRGLAVLVPKGMRAYTIMTSRLAANVAGFILPGNKADVLLNLRGTARDGTGGGSTTTLLQAVEVLAVDQRLEAPADNRVEVKGLSSVTLLVTPQQAALLDLGQSMGMLSLSLRNMEDIGDAKVEPATIAQIQFRQEKPTFAEAATPPPTTVTPDERPQSPSIVTLRGSSRGRVLVGER